MTGITEAVIIELAYAFADSRVGNILIILSRLIFVYFLGKVGKSYAAKFISKQKTNYLDRKV